MSKRIQAEEITMYQCPECCWNHADEEAALECCGDFCESCNTWFDQLIRMGDEDYCQECADYYSQPDPNPKGKIVRGGN